MNQRSLKIKKFYFKHKNGIHTTILFIVAIALFIIGYYISWNYIEKPMNDAQFRACEQVAKSVYEQNSNMIVEVPEGFYVSIDTTSISVKLDSQVYRGKVVGKLQNGEFVTIKDYQINEGVSISILMGLLFILGLFLIVVFYYAVIKKNSKT